MDVQQVEAKLYNFKNESKKCDDAVLLVFKAKIDSNNFKLTHDQPGSVSHVNIFQFHDCQLAAFPRAKVLLDLVENLTCLAIGECGLTKITRKDLRGFGSLKELHLGYNLIEKLPRDLFFHTPNLELISLQNNKIDCVEPGILDSLPNLKYCNLKDNVSFDCAYNSIGDPNNIGLNILKELISLKYQTAMINKQIADQKAVSKMLIEETARLKEETARLKEEIAILKILNQNRVLVELLWLKLQGKKNGKCGVRWNYKY